MGPGMVWNGVWERDQSATCSDSSEPVTFPVRETSPVMATFCLAGCPRARERRAEMIVTPALGPSLGVAPSGT